MPYNGNGTFNRIYSWQIDKINGIKIRADRMDGDSDGFATGLSTAVCKDGQTTPTANLPMGGFKHTGVALASSATDYLRADQIQSNGLTYYTTGGSADAYTLTPAPVISALAGGQTWKVKISATNLTTTPTLAVSGTTAKTIVNNDLSAVSIGLLAINTVWEVLYEASADKYLIVNRPAPLLAGLADGGLKTATFSALSNSRYRMKGVANPPPCASLPVGTAGDVILLVAYGTFGGQMCGTINGISQTVPFTQQSLWIGYSSTAGWV